MGRRGEMRGVVRSFSCLWWFGQGIMCFGITFLTRGLCIGTGVVLILCGLSCLSNDRELSVMSQLFIMLYTIGYCLIAYFIIVLGYHGGWAIAGLSFVALLNIAFCSVSGYKLIRKRKRD